MRIEEKFSEPHPSACFERLGRMDTSVSAGPAETRQSLDRLLAELRPKLHRYCARMTGSVIDGEDVLQEALTKAIEAFPAAGPLSDPAAWLFRIAHNTALDLHRRRARQDAARSDEDPDMIVDPASSVHHRESAAASLRTFMRLPVVQRSSVILTDVLGYSLEEVGGIMGASLPAVKAALHRGRKRLRRLAQEPDDHPLPVLAEGERALLAAYLDRFNAHDFDAIRNMLADEVRIELVNRSRMTGRTETARYFSNYARLQDWHLTQGFVDRRPAVLVRDPREAADMLSYFILLEWAGTSITNIRDFRFAPYATKDAEVIVAS